MPDTSSLSLRERNRQHAREAVLDAAERLLRRSPDAEFSMRALAAEAKVSFATPFNHFGSKNAIMQALSLRLIQQMSARFSSEERAGDSIDRVLKMGEVCIAMLQQKPDVHKAVVGSLGMPQSNPSGVHQHSRKLWSLALGDCAGISSAGRPLAQRVLSRQLAFHFRGCISFWIAAEISDEDLGPVFREGAACLMLGFAARKRKAFLIAQIADGLNLVDATGRSPA